MSRFFEISSKNGVKAYLKDHLGSVLNSAASGGKPVYGIYDQNSGNAMSTSNFNEPVTYGFTGREFDAETGLYYSRVRYYDPSIGRFLQQDPYPGKLTRPITVTNRYAYAGNNPIRYRDPSGKAFGFDDFAVGLGVGALSGALASGIANGFTPSNLLTGAVQGALTFNTVFLTAWTGFTAGGLAGAAIGGGISGAGMGAFMNPNHPVLGAFLGLFFGAGSGGILGLGSLVPKGLDPFSFVPAIPSSDEASTNVAAASGATATEIPFVTIPDDGSPDDFRIIPNSGGPAMPVEGSWGGGDLTAPEPGSVGSTYPRSY
jgi:RHS repeat-associated protein